MLESFLNSVAGLRSATLLKKRFQHWCFPVNIFKNTYFEEHLLTGASASAMLKFCNDANIYEQINYIFLNVKNSSFMTLEVHALY